jgi:DNA polymerase-1
MSAIPRTEPAEASFSHESNDQELSILDHRLDHPEDSTIAAEKSNIALKSKPKEGGNWNRSAPLEWCSSFGGRDPSKEAALLERAQLKPGDEGYFDVSNITVPGVTIVRNKRDAQIVLERLLSAESQTLLHSCDTEVMDIELKNVGPVGNGYVTCLSLYSGPDFDYGLGDGPGTILWVDNLDDAFGVLQEFKPFFEDERFLTVWHNYGFDRHVMWNEGIDVKGFGGDTMHMARLQDTSRAKYGAGRGYSLEALTDDLVGRRKKPMKEIFGVPRLRKDGTPGSLVDLPPIEVLQRDPKFRLQWIVYSAYDAEGTWLLRSKLQKMLEKMPWVDDKNLFDYYWMHMRKFGEVLTDMERRGINVDAKEYLFNVEIQAREDRAGHMKAFRQWAQKMIGPDGLAINPASSTQLGTFLFGGAQNQKTKETTEKIRKFTVPREEITDEAMELYRLRDEEAKKKLDPKEAQLDEFDEMKAAELKALCKQYGLKVSGKKSELQERLRGHFLATNNIEMIAGGDDFESMSEDDLRDACVARQLSDTGNRDSLLKRLRDDDAFALELLSASTDRSVDGYRSISEALEAAAQSDGGALSEILKDLKEKSQAEPKKVEVTISSIGMIPKKFTAGGAPSCTADVLRSLAGDPFDDQPKYGTVSSNSCH